MKLSEAAAALAVAFVAIPAAAQVMDVAPDGRVTVVDGPSVQLSADPGAARPIRPQTRGIAAAAPPGAVRSPAPLRETIRTAARTQGLGADLVDAVAWQESRYRPDAVSPKGARGVMQLMPDTARSLGARDGDVTGNVHAGAAYLHLLLARYDGDLVKALAAYNAGPAAVDRHRGVPPFKETRAYVDAVLEQLADRVAPLPQSAARRRP